MAALVLMESPPAPRPSPLRQSVVLAGWVLLCFGAAASSALGSPGQWYTELNKPTWNPPGWIFGPVWSALYLSMAVAAWLVWREGGWPWQRRALGLFLVQWALNFLWTPLFFGLHRPGLAFAEILLLWLAIAATAVAFWRIRKPAGALLVPYLAWVSFAAVLNGVLWQMNP